MSRQWVRRVQWAALALLLLAVAAWSLSSALAGEFFRGGAVGGVIVEVDGVLRAAKVDEMNELLEVRARQLERISGDMNVATPLRKVSLRRLQEEYLARKDKVQMPFISEDMEYLSGLTRIQYVFVYPEQKDIVLVGPAEPIKVSKNGHMVGTETGQPILQLDHLLIALRTAQSAARQPISCSIDPTREGVEAFQKIIQQTKRVDQSLTGRLKEAMGLQQIRITGVPPNSDFARTMVAADYRMKQLAMGLERSPIRELPSYVSMVQANSGAMPRWWMAPNYDALLRDPDGVAWELRGPGVKVMTEDTLFTADGSAKRTGKANAAAQRWADRMTANYEKLSVHYPIFGELRNVMDMAVIGALIVKENLREKASLDMSVLMNDREITAMDDFPVPKKVPTEVTSDKRGSRWIITASGGVEINSWKVADKVETNKKLSPVRESSAPSGEKWWWN